MRLFKKGPDKEPLSEIEELKQAVINASMSEAVEKVALKDLKRE